MSVWGRAGRAAYGGGKGTPLSREVCPVNARLRRTSMTGERERKSYGNQKAIVGTLLLICV